MPVAGEAFFAQVASFAGGIGHPGHRPAIAAASSRSCSCSVAVAAGPWPLLAVLLATGCVAAFGLRHGNGVVGPVPAGLPAPASRT